MNRVYKGGNDGDDIKKREQKTRKIYPHFVVDIEERTAMLNGQLFDLNPSAEDIKRDGKFGNKIL